MNLLLFIISFTKCKISNCWSLKTDMRILLDSIYFKVAWRYGTVIINALVRESHLCTLNFILEFWINPLLLLMLLPLSVFDVYKHQFIKVERGDRNKGTKSTRNTPVSITKLNNCNLFDKKWISSNGQSLSIVHSLISNAHNVYAVCCCKIQCIEI